MRAGSLIFYKSDFGYQLLVVRGVVSGKWGLVKGMVEIGESVFDCAVRETSEEVGVTDLDYFSWGIKIKGCIYFVARVESKPIIRIQRSEIAAYKWVSISDMKLLNTTSDCRMAVKKFMDTMNTIV